MHAKSIVAAAAVEVCFDSGKYANANNLSALVLEQLPIGEHAWLTPEVVTDREPDDAPYWPTESGRDLVARWRAERALFGREVS
jgi:hypothetical protein